MNFILLCPRCVVISSAYVQIMCLFPCCSGCPTDGLTGATELARSSQSHLVSSSRPVWTDQPAIHHSVWQDHFLSYHTPQLTFLLTTDHHRAGCGAAVLCKSSRSYTEWKWYFQQLAVSDYLRRCESNTTACDTLSGHGQT